MSRGPYGKGGATRGAGNKAQARARRYSHIGDVNDDTRRPRFGRKDCPRCGTKFIGRETSKYCLDCRVAVHEAKNKVDEDAVRAALNVEQRRKEIAAQQRKKR